MQKIIQWCERMKALEMDYEDVFYQALCNSACYQHYLSEIEDTEGPAAADEQHAYHSGAAIERGRSAFTPEELEILRSIKVRAN
jgi:hypothetical protein